MLHGNQTAAGSVYAPIWINKPGSNNVIHASIGGNLTGNWTNPWIHLPTLDLRSQAIVYEVAAAGIVSLDVAIAGVGTVTPALAVKRALAVSIAGIGSVSPALSVKRTLAVAISGLGTVTVALRRIAGLAVSIAGQGSVSPSLTVTGGGPPAEPGRPDDPNWPSRMLGGPWR